MEDFRNETAATFLAVNVDEDRSSVPAFLKEVGWTVPVAYGHGLDQLLGVSGLPTIVIFDRQGRIVFRQEGVDPEGFVGELEKHLREVLHEPAGGRS
jgi:thioredoxin-related protein